MKSARFFSLVFLILIFAFSTLSYGDVPQMISYQGKITTAAGALVDTTVGMRFTIYDDSTGFNSLWDEFQDSVKVEKGCFSVLLGSVDSIPISVFDGSVRYLQIKVGDDDPMTSRKPIVSTAYAFRAATVQPGGIDCSDCDDRFVNVQGPDSVFVDSGTAFLGTADGSSTWPGIAIGIRGYASSTSTGHVYGGFFTTSSSGTGMHCGIWSEALGSSSATTFGACTKAENTSTGPAVGLACQAENMSTGEAIAGNFFAFASGSGVHYGVVGASEGSASASTYGSKGWASNISSGDVYGGYFSTTDRGTGDHTGVYAGALGSSSSPTYGSMGYADNTSDGQAYGGHFTTGASGTGIHTAVFGDGSGNSSSSVIGVHGFAQNPSTGNVYAGYFRASSTGTGIKYGVYAQADTGVGYAGYFAGDVKITDSLVVLGSKSAAVKVDNGEYRLLYCVESTENWFEDFGEAHLINGKAVVNIEALFSQTVNTGLTYHVFLTPGGECSGLYVTNKKPYSFEVRELNSGNSSITFSYRIVAKRKGFESLRLAKMGGPTPEEVAAQQAKFQVEMEKERERIKLQREKVEQERVSLHQQNEPEMR